MTTLYQCDNCKHIYDDRGYIEWHPGDRFKDLDICKACYKEMSEAPPQTLLEAIQEQSKSKREGKVISPSWSHRFTNPTMEFIYLNGDPDCIVPTVRYTRELKIPSQEEFEEVVDLIRKNYWHNHEWNCIRAELKSRAGRKEEKTGYVYVLYGTEGKFKGYYRIGASNKPHNRKPRIEREKATKTRSILWIKAQAYLALERIIHTHCRWGRVSDEREWFDLKEDDLAYLVTLAEQSGGEVFD